MRALAILLSAFAAATLIACSASKPTADVPATVEAGIQSTKEAEAAVASTVTAQVESARAAERTPTAETTATLAPTRIAAPTARPEPTPQPQVTMPPATARPQTDWDAAALAIELFTCMKENRLYAEWYKRSRIQRAVAGGASEDVATELMGGITSDQTLFALAMQEAINSGAADRTGLELDLQECEEPKASWQTEIPQWETTKDDTDPETGDRFCLRFVTFSV